MSETVRIVAEAAQGFEGDPTAAKLLARAAAKSGADVVKFQLVYARELATPTYQYFSLFQQLEMPDEAWQVVAAEARTGNIALAFDVFGLESLALAQRLGAAFVKVHVTDFFNDALIDQALGMMPEVHFSAGGMTPDDIAAFLERRSPEARRRLTLLYGFQSEPTATVDNQLRRLTTLAARFPGLPLGFLDHADGAADEGGWLGVLAVALGARVIEKHITLDRALQMEDYVSALGSQDFAAYARRIRTAEEALGSGDVALRPAEQAYRGRAVKIAVAARAIAKGAVVSREDIALLRGVPEAGRQTIERVTAIEGRTAAQAIDAWQPFYPESLS